MSLADEITKRQAQARAYAARQANPELEVKLDRFVADNPQLRERYNAMSKGELIRKLMFAKMERAETADARNRELAPWVKENPAIVAKVEQRLKTTVGQKRQSENICAGEKRIHHARQAGTRHCL